MRWTPLPRSTATRSVVEATQPGVSEISATERRAWVVVLGDLGRSPRMLHHAESLLRRRESVVLLGFTESPLPLTVSAAEVVALPLFAGLRRRRPPALAPLFAVARHLLLFIALLRVMLVRARSGDVVLVQVPPLASLAALLVSGVRDLHVVFDWHNLAAPLVAARFGRPLATVTAAAERLLKRWAAPRLTVSRALASQIGTATVLYDFPTASSPHPTITQRIGFPLVPGVHRATEPVSRPATRHVLIVAPSSFGIDDDFDLLVEALSRVDREVGIEDFPLIIALTGQGERRSAIEDACDRLCLRRITVVTSWLDPESYRALLGSADAGLSLHRSASGLDLPLKLTELTGSGTPVLALDYGPVLRELGDDLATWFRDSEELAIWLLQMARGLRLPAPPRMPRWDEEWQRLAWPLLNPSMPPAPHAAATRPHDPRQVFDR